MRAFEYDAFISHNSFDGAESLVEDLETHDARVFCDEAIDLSDRRVLDRVGQGLIKSRCVVLHVAPGFRDSEWCRAEYEPALHQSLGYGVTRIVVARAGADAQIPSSLTTVPVFDVHDSASALADFLVTSNRIPDDVAQEVMAQKTAAYGAPLGVRRDVGMRNSRLLENVSHLRESVASKDAALPANVLTNRLRRARWSVDSPDVDSRVRGFRTLIREAALQNDRQFLKDVKGYLRRELDEAGLRETLWTYFRAGLPAEEEDKWLAAALVRMGLGGKLLNNVPKEFLDRMPESIRCRVVLGGLDLSTLTAHERMLLLDQRLQTLVDDDLALDPYLPAELEGTLSKLMPYLDDDAVAEIRADYRRIIENVLVLAERHSGEPIRSMGPGWNVLVEPLARFLTDPEISLELFDRACQVVEEESGEKDLVNYLRVKGHLVRSGLSWDEAGLQADKA